MLEVASLRYRNFLSYGDYETCIDNLDELGPVLITGETADGDSNGAGKSTITTVILWILFGRVFNKDKPGDNVINWVTGSNCYGELKTTDGWIIRRTRKMKGHDDLLVYDSTGADQTRSTNDAAQKFINKKFGLDYHLFVSSTFFGQLTKSFLETSDTARKEVLERLLGLDRINAWAEVAREKLKAVESRQESLRTGVSIADRDITKYQQMADTNNTSNQTFELTRQTRLDELSDEVEKLHNAISVWDLEVSPKLAKYKETHDKLAKLQQAREAVLNQIAELRPKITQFKRDSANITGEIEKLKVRKSELSLIDYTQLRTQHTINATLTVKFSDLTNALNDLSLKIRAMKMDYEAINKTIKNWAEAAGTVCPSCKQSIDASHVTDLCGPYRDEATLKERDIKVMEAEFKTLYAERSAIKIVNVEYSIVELNKMETEHKSIDTKIEKYEAQVVANTTESTTASEQLAKLIAQEQRAQIALTSSRPPMTMADVESSYRANVDDHKRLKALVADINRKKAEVNPFVQIATDLKNTIDGLVLDRSRSQAELDELNVTASHYLYLWRSYSERSKVKRLILSKLIPFLNERIRYYLDCFGCDIVLSFKDNLSVESNVWSYDYCSGGERKRIDLALMFALYDLYLGIHGRQCNIMVLDEVDGRLDGTGIDALINVILNDFTKDQPGRVKPGTVFVISHRPEMLDAFPAKIVVKRDENRQSHVVDVR